MELPALAVLHEVRQNLNYPARLRERRPPRAAKEQCPEWEVIRRQIASNTEKPCTQTDAAVSAEACPRAELRVASRLLKLRV